jgi:predicted metal-dependent hydrolase
MDRSAAKEAPQLSLFGDETTPAAAGATRFVLLAGQPVEYRFSRRKRRTIGIRVSAQGLAVSAPFQAPWREIEGFLRDKEAWILEKLATWSTAEKPRPLHGENGESLPIFGRETLLVVAAGRRRAALLGPELHVMHPQPHRRGAVRRIVAEWLKGHVLSALTPRAAHFAARLDLPPPPVAISRARTQWGVCTADGRIRLSWRLGFLAPELCDYVVAHEVAHLVELNHSERFWALVEWLYPHWQEARERIERDAATLPRL